MSGLEFASLNTPRARGLLYGFVALASMVVFGNISEVCDYLDSCPARLIWIIVFAVAATIVASVMLAATLLHIGAILKLEIVFSLSLLILYAICVGLVSSIRTGVGNVISVSFSWFCLVVAFILLFASFTADGGPLEGILKKTYKKTARDLELGRGEEEEMSNQEEEVEVPEEAYMQSTGQDVASEEKKGAGESPLKPVNPEAPAPTEL